MAPSLSQKASLKALLKRGELLVAPRVLDRVSLEQAERVGFQALTLMRRGGESYPEAVERVHALAAASAVPLICDAGTGFGGLMGVAFSVKGYEVAGASAIVLEDRERCGRTGAHQALSAEEAATKIRVAVEARSSPDFLIVARVAAGAALGVGEAIARGRAYAEAGADVLFFDAPESEAALASIGSALGDVPLLLGAAEGGKPPALGERRYAELGFRAAVLPASAYLSSAQAMEVVLGQLNLPGYSFDSDDSKLAAPAGPTAMWVCGKGEGLADDEGVAEPPLKKFRSNPGVPRVMI